nr:transposase family protein [Brachybacterium muris]
MLATKVHSRRSQQVRDVPVAGAMAVVWAKRRWFCLEPACARRTFWEATDQVPHRALNDPAAKPDRLRGDHLWPGSLRSGPGPWRLVVAGPGRAGGCRRGPAHRRGRVSDAPGHR